MDSKIETGKRILLVDDQEDVRETVKLLLSLDEHSVVEARHGKEGLQLFESGHFDLVITDFAMPVMKGDEMSRLIKQLAPGQPILMITGSAEKFGGIDAAVDCLLKKPFGFEDLRHAISQVLSLPEVTAV